ncbi:hypothetical protein FNF31_02531 [Cafeteria roenbergensis]|uniref:CSC1/OSCA1-like cytosolic domain-containing protein n=1 Tax=Cafeteria roenbergensis TaxID=33653 RepID=A0A5A8DF35_CAFRO|nr:hypothetical protein FNF31_02531 [Cafeteria roenbergensis]
MSSSRRAARAAVQGPTTRSRPDAPTGGLTSLTPALEASRGHEPEPSPGADWDDDDVDSTGTAGEEAAADESAEEAQLAEKQQQPKLAIEHEFPPILEAVIRDTYSERKEDQDRVKKDMAMAGRPHYKFLSLRTARENMHLSHPRKAKGVSPDGRVLEWTHLSICDTELGSHGCTWLCCLCRLRAVTKVCPCLSARNCAGVNAVPSELSEFGVGVGLYFKLLKYLAFIFAIMLFFSIPNAILFWFGNGLLDSSVTITDSLALLTIGNLGEGTAACEQSRGRRDLQPCLLAWSRVGLRVSSAPGTVYSWQPQSAFGTDCTETPAASAPASSPARAPYNASSQMCEDTLESAGGLDDCPARSSRRLTIIGTCYATQLNLFDGVIIVDKDIVGIFVSLFDFCSIFVFLVAAWYLSTAEVKDTLTRVRMTVADFSIFIPALPRGVAEDTLEHDLRWHFTSLLRKLRHEKGLPVDDIPSNAAEMEQWRANPAGDRRISHAGGEAAVAAAEAAAGRAPALPGHGRVPTIGVDTAVHFPVVADINFGYAQGRLLRLLIFRGTHLRMLEYHMMKLSIHKQELLVKAQEQVLKGKVADVRASIKRKAAEKRREQRRQSHTVTPRSDAGSRFGSGFRTASPRGISVGVSMGVSEEDDDLSSLSEDEEGGMGLGLDAENVSVVVGIWLSSLSKDKRVAQLREKIRKLSSDIERLNLDIDTERARATMAAKELHRLAQERLMGYHDDEAEPAVQVAEAPVTAFVTFSSTTDRALVMEAYREPWLIRCCKRGRIRDLMLQTALRLPQGLRVRAAPAPSDVNFENQDVTAGSRVLRQCATLLVTLIILGGAAVALFFTEDTKRTLLRENPPRDCRAFSTDVLTNQTAAVRDEYWQFFGAVSGNTGVLECYCRNVLSKDPGALFNINFVVPVVDIERVPSTQSDYAEIKLAAERGEYYEGAPFTTREAKLCETWFNSFLQVQALIYGSAAITLLVNFAVRFIINFLVRQERLGSKTAETASRALKLFLLQFLNTGALVLILNAQIDTEFEPLRKGQFRDYSAEWYRSVGVSLTIVMLANVFIPHLTPLFFCMKSGTDLCIDRRCTCDPTITRATTAQQLAQVLRGPEFLVAERVAQVYTIVFVCVVYSTGLPVLLAVATVSMLLFWLVDFVLFVRVYRKPAPIDGSLSSLFTAMLPFAAVLHLCMGIWMLSNESIFPPADTLTIAARFTASLGASAEEVDSIFGSVSAFQELLQTYDPSGSLQIGTRISRTHVLPQLCMLLVLVLAIVLGRLVFRCFSRTILTIFPCLRGLECCMSTYDLLNNRAVAAQRKLGKRLQESNNRAQVEEVIGDDSTDGETQTVATTPGDDASTVGGFDGAFDVESPRSSPRRSGRGGCCGCCCADKASAYSAPKTRSKRRRAKQAKSLDTGSLLYRIENGLVPSYWQAVPTDVLEAVVSDQRSSKPELKVLFRKALAMRTEDIRARAVAKARVAALAEEASLLRQNFVGVVQPAYAEALLEAEREAKEEQAVRDAIRKRQAAVAAAQTARIRRMEQLRSAELEQQTAAFNLAAADAHMQSLKKDDSAADERLQAIRAKLLELHKPIGFEHAKEAVAKPQPARPDITEVSRDDLRHCEREISDLNVDIEQLSSDIKKCKTALTAAQAREAAKPGSPAKKADSKDKAATAGAAAAAAGGGESGDSDDDDDADDSDAEEAKATSAATHKKKLLNLEGTLSDKRKKLVRAEAHLKVLMDKSKVWTKFHEEDTLYWLYSDMVTITHQLSQLRNKLSPAAAAKLKRAEEASKKIDESHSKAALRYEEALQENISVLKSAAREARASKRVKEATGYEASTERIQTVGGSDMHLVELPSVADEGAGADAKAGAGLGPSATVVMAPSRRTGVPSLGSYGRLTSATADRGLQLLTLEQAMQLSLPEVESLRSTMAQQYKRRIQDAISLYTASGLGVDLRVSVSGAQFLSDVHSYARMDAESYRYKLGKGLMLPAHLTDSGTHVEDSFGGAVAHPEDTGAVLDKDEVTRDPTEADIRYMRHCGSFGPAERAAAVAARRNPAGADSQV